MHYLNNCSLPPLKYLQSSSPSNATSEASLFQELKSRSNTKSKPLINYFKLKVNHQKPFILKNSKTEFHPYHNPKLKKSAKKSHSSQTMRASLQSRKSRKRSRLSSKSIKSSSRKTTRTTRNRITSRNVSMQKWS